MKVTYPRLEPTLLPQGSIDRPPALSDLPRDLMDAIFLHLDDSDAARLASTCRELFSRRERSREEQFNIFRRRERMTGNLRSLRTQYERADYDASMTKIISKCHRNAFFMTKTLLYCCEIDVLCSLRTGGKAIIAVVLLACFFPIEVILQPLIYSYRLADWFFGAEGKAARCAREAARRRLERGEDIVRQVKRGSDLLRNLRDSPERTMSV